MNKVNKEIRSKLKFAGAKILKVGLGLLAGVFFLVGCGEQEGQILFESESGEKNVEIEQTQQENVQENFQNEVQQSNLDESEGRIDESDSLCYVYVCGAIANPGVYEVDNNTRICEVIQYAGGLTKEAETTCINQALAVYDGLMLAIPTVTQWENGEYILDENGFPVQAPKALDSKVQEAESQVDDGKVNINQASIEQLCTLPGVGTSRAESIIAYRQEYGAFQTIEDIKNVSGIKDGLFEKIKGKIKV